MFETRREALAWAAGFFDGEGCFYAYKLYKRKDGTNLMMFRANLVQKDRTLIDRFCEVIGPLGSMGHKPTNDCWHWSTTRKGEAEVLFNMLKPWLSQRRIQRAEELMTEEKSQILRGKGGSPRKGLR
jgi:hypothetical protein